MKRLILLLALFQLSCGIDRGYIEPALAPYVSQFSSLVGYPLSGIIVEYGDVLSPSIGVCIKGKSIPRVIIKKSTFKNLSEARRWALVAHELGHCILNRVHTINDQPDNCPVSIMDSTIVSDTCLGRHLDYYNLELLHGG